MCKNKVICAFSLPCWESTCTHIKVLKSSSRLPSSPCFTAFHETRVARSAAFARFRAPLGIFVKTPFIVSKLQRGPTAPTLTGPLPLLFPRVALPALSPRGPPPLHFSQSTPTPAPPRPNPRNSASSAPPRGSMDQRQRRRCDSSGRSCPSLDPWWCPAAPAMLFGRPWRLL
jgi:hypothetical protein